MSTPSITLRTIAEIAEYLGVGGAPSAIASRADSSPPLEKALLDHLGRRKTLCLRIEIAGLTVWGALPAGTAPNAEPWDPQADLGRLIEDVMAV